ncbi:MAG: hydrogenase formation protein HypD [Planctomycetota bacterium]|nr:hydrogenase formation protein HypD [Planctomycetota bacterium]
MKHLDEYRSEAHATGLAEAIRRRVTKPWTLMEICGGQTHTLIRSGIDRMLPDEVTLVHGPGCPVCVTPIGVLDAAVDLVKRPEVTLLSFGDMLRVPGTSEDLLGARARGGDVRMVYSPLDAVQLAAAHPEREVVFLAVGFETTAPACALAVKRAKQEGLTNFSILCAHVRVPPAMEAILDAPDCRVQGFLAAGHVCTVMGYHEYEPIAERYGIPITVTGFEPSDLLQGIAMTLDALEAETHGVTNQYTRVVTREGNGPAQAVLDEVFDVVDREWRGIGTIPGGGFGVAKAYAAYDAAKKFGLGEPKADIDNACIAGEILRGVKRPPACPAFGTDCTPDHPLGAPMVSSEGACAAYYRYGRRP